VKKEDAVVDALGKAKAFALGEFLGGVEQPKQKVIRFGEDWRWFFDHD
jgi:hypothetical protein